MKIVVIGAGSVGTHVAYRLTQEGADVTLVEAGEPGRGTSSATFAWLSTFPQLGWDEEPGRAAMRKRGHASFRELEEELGEHFVDWCGTVTVSWGAEADELRERMVVANGKGAGVVELDAAELAEVEPALRLRDGDAAFYQEASGWVDVARLIGILLERARSKGMRLLTGTAVTGIRVQDELVRGVETAGGETIGCDAVVNAAGSWGTHIAAMARLTVPLDLVPGRIDTTVPLADGAKPRTVISSPFWQVRPAPNGGVLINGRGTIDSDGTRNVGRMSDLGSSLFAYLPCLEDVAIADSRVGIRPVPPGGPIIGTLPWLPNMFHTLSHGGIGWAPTWGRIVARELLHGETVPELANMRPLRFHKDVEELGRFADDAEQVAR